MGYGQMATADRQQQMPATEIEPVQLTQISQCTDHPVQAVPAE